MSSTVSTSDVSPITMSDNASFSAYCEQLKEAYPQNNRILLVQIPQVILGSFNRDIALNRGYYAFPPTGLQYIYEAIKDRGLEIEILDINLELLKRVFEDDTFDPQDWPLILEERLKSFKPYIVGVSCLFDIGIGPLLDTMRLVRQMGSSVVVAGGVIATYEWQNLLKDDLAHFVIKGEGENKMNFLLDQLMDTTQAPATPGIYFSPGDGIHETSAPPDVVPVVGDLRASYDLVPIEEYYKYGSLNPFSRRHETGKAAYAAIQFSRGCRAACTFCAVRDFMGKGVRHRSVDDVLSEMEYLITEKGVRHFEWLDDDLLFHRKAVQELLAAVIDKGWNITWSANNGLIATSIDEETLRLINDSGCLGFKVGIETGNAEMLKKVRKPGKHNKFLSFSKMLSSYPKPFVGGNFIVGLPEETFLQMMDTFRFSMEIELDWAGITVCQIIRGASAFSDSGEYFEHQMKSEGQGVSNFIPARDSKQGHVDADDGVLHNLDIFNLEPDLIPSEEQVKEIWFTFNVIVNYVHNKNLMPGGHPEKFVSWIQTAQRAYPTNPYMMLFLALALVSCGEDEQATACHEKAIEFSQTDYWQGRFKAFGLDVLLNGFPQDAQGVHKALKMLQDHLQPAYADWAATPRGEGPKRLAAGVGS